MEKTEEPLARRGRLQFAYCLGDKKKTWVQRDMLTMDQRFAIIENLRKKARPGPRSTFRSLPRLAGYLADADILERESVELACREQERLLND